MADAPSPSRTCSQAASTAARWRTRPSEGAAGHLSASYSKVVSLTDLAAFPGEEAERQAAERAGVKAAPHGQLVGTVQVLRRNPVDQGLEQQGIPLGRIGGDRPGPKPMGRG